MEKKVLFCASTLSHLINFHLPYLRDFRVWGYQVWTAAGSGNARAVPYADRQVDVPFRKRIFSPWNILAIFRLRRLLMEEGFDCISTHTTLASAVVRAAVLLMPKKRRPKVYCICHGYLFHEGDGLKKWLYLLPEKICAPVTDVLMVMNREDGEIAKKHHLAGGRLMFVRGMGLDMSRFRVTTGTDWYLGRQALGIEPEEYVLIYAAEFSKRKNQGDLIRAFAKAAEKRPRMRLLLAGSGGMLEECKALVEGLGLGERVTFLGYVEGMEKIYPLCDVAVSSSRIEGLPFNIMEAMACELPVIASKIKGHTDLLGDDYPMLYTSEEELVGLLESAENELDRVDWSSRLEPYLLPAVQEKLRMVYGEDR